MLISPIVSTELLGGRDYFKSETKKMMMIPIGAT